MNKIYEPRVKCRAPMCNGKASVHRTARLAAAFVRNALLVTSTDRENSVQCSFTMCFGGTQTKTKA